VKERFVFLSVSLCLCGGLFAFLLASAALAAPLTNSVTGHLRLAWSYDTNQLSTNLAFIIYGSTNLAQPVSSWPILTNVPGTNTSCDLWLTPAQYFFVGTASNFWGETSVTSNLVVTPPAPQPINDSLKIQKGAP
jgi:hypothetical protein